MADPLFVIGVIANIIQLVDFSAGVLARVKEYRVKSSEIPAAFAHIATQLPLLREVLERSKEGIKSETISPAEVKAIAPCLEGCQQQLEKLQAVLATILPEAQHGKTKRLTKAFRGMWKESIVSKIDAEIESYVSRLTFYYAWSASKLDLSTRKSSVPIEGLLWVPS